jgi:ABC-2 type transport system permease protein
VIGTVLRVSWLELRRDKVALLLSFVLPLAFFSMFAVVFGGMSGGGSTRKIEVLVVDEEGSTASTRLAQALAREDALAVATADEDGATLTAERARALVKEGEAPIAIVIPRGFEAGFAAFGDDDAPAIEVLYDASDPVAPHMVGGLLQRDAMMAMPDVLIERGLGELERWGGGLTPGQRAAMDRFLPLLRRQSEPAAESADDGGGGFSGLVRVAMVDVHTTEADAQRKSATIAFYAAGTGVMFLLFSMTGAGGALLEEEERGTLERVLGTRVSMGRLLTGKWLFLSLMGVLQVTLMFSWGALVFGLDLFTPEHLLGFAIMTLVTAGAASGFGLVLATACRSRAQLGGLSTIVILLMSALGGSMFPRFLMPEGLQKAGLATFNAWALDGYQKVFWYETGPASLWPQVLVLSGLAAVFLAVARRLARRWETG